MQVGIVGKPNVGKSTFFRACTMAPAEIADYPFTTIQPNRGVGFVRAPCPHLEFKLAACDPNNSPCLDGTRFVPTELIDVAGLVPKAHEGRGLGNKFLDDLRQADVLVHIVDASGGTDAEGNPVAPGSYDPTRDIAWLEEEVVLWVHGILLRDWDHLMRRMTSATGAKPEQVLGDKLTFFGVKEKQVKAALEHTGIDAMAIAQFLVKQTKPILVAANKVDKAAAPTVETLVGMGAVPCAAESELALRKAKEAGVLRYAPGDADFQVAEPGKLNDRQAKALEYMRHHVLQPYQGTGVQQALEKAVFVLLDHIVVFPVEDETHLTNKDGDVLPDALLVKRGTTAREMAYRVHTELGEHFIRAVDARTKRVIGADHVLAHGDVVRIVAGK